MREMFVKMQTRVIVADEAGSAPAAGGVAMASPTAESPVGTVGVDRTDDGQQESAPCPRCSNDAPVRLAKADPQANTCFRCRICGHIFSPRD